MAANLAQGKIYWAHIVGAPFEDQYKGLGWSFDFAVDPATKAAMLKKGVPEKKFRNKDDERGDFLTFFRPAETRSGEPGKPFSIVDSHKKDWDPTKLIGNGSVVNIQWIINKREFKGKTFMVPSVLGLQVWDLVNYEGGGFKERTDDTPNETPDDELPNW